MEDEKNTGDLDDKTRKLKAEADRLEALLEGLDSAMNECMGRMAVRGLVGALVFIPFLGFVVYAAARIALRKSSKP